MVVEEQKHDVTEDVVEEEDVAFQQNTDKPDVYAIGKRFVFWESQSQHPDYIKPKYANMKEEILQSPLVFSVEKVDEIGQCIDWKQHRIQCGEQ